MKVFSDSACYG